MGQTTETSFYTIPVALTATALWITTISPLANLSSMNLKIPSTSPRSSWDETALFSNSEEYAVVSKIETIRTFANTLLSESVDMPPEISRAIDENFWDLL